MTRLLVWDLPVRLFHLLLGLTFIGAFTIANVVDDDSVLFSAHMLLGLLMAFMVVLRLIWGFVGTKHARFGDFLHGPKAVVTYLRDVFRGKARRHAGHNPGSSVAIFLMLLLVVGLATTGILMASGDESLEDVHGVLSWAFLIVVVGHIGGVVLHTVRQKENLTASMIDGRKEVEPTQAIATSHPVLGLVFLALVGLVSWRLAAGFDPATRPLTLPLIGQTLQLGEVEEGGAGSDRKGHDDDD
jgi:cytochrome b